MGFLFLLKFSKIALFLILVSISVSKRCQFFTLYSAKYVLYPLGNAFEVFRRSVRIYVLRYRQRCVSKQILFELRLNIPLFQPRRICMPQNVKLI